MILFFHDLYSCVKNFYYPLIAQFYSFMKNVSLNINFTFSQKLTFNAKLFILPWLFWWWSFGEDLMFFSCCLSSVWFCGRTFTHHMIYILVGTICITFPVEWYILPLGEFVLIVWFILQLGEFVSFCLSYDLYFRLGNLFHFASRKIYSQNQQRFQIT